MSRAAIVVDVQRDFCEGGSLAVAGGAAVAQAISDHLQANQSDTHLAVATRDFHIDPGEHFSDHPDYETTWPRHCVAGTSGADFHANLDMSLITEIFLKGAWSGAYSGFEGAARDTHEPLAAWLRDHGVDELEVMGIATDHCVRATALDGVREGFAVRVNLGLTAGVARETTDRALAELRSAGVSLIGEPVVLG